MSTIPTPRPFRPGDRVVWTFAYRSTVYTARVVIVKIGETECVIRDHETARTVPTRELSRATDPQEEPT